MGECDLQSTVCDICNKLLTDNSLITTKVVLSILSKMHNFDQINQDKITEIINLWRLSRISAATEQQHQQIPNNNSNYKKQLLKAKREIQFLKAKMKALNSFYNRQRQEFIMRIEGMLYK